MFIDKYQRVFLNDGHWIRRGSYSLKIPIRKNFKESFQILLYKKSNSTSGKCGLGESTSSNCGPPNSEPGTLFLSESIFENTKVGILCEHTGK